MWGNEMHGVEISKGNSKSSEGGTDKLGQCLGKAGLHPREVLACADGVLTSCFQEANCLKYSSSRQRAGHGLVSIKLETTTCIFHIKSIVIITKDAAMYYVRIAPTMRNKCAIRIRCAV